MESSSSIGLLSTLDGNPSNYGDYAALETVSEDHEGGGGSKHKARGMYIYAYTAKITRHSKILPTRLLKAFSTFL